MRQGCLHDPDGKAFPKSEFHGFDYHDKSIELARLRLRIKVWRIGLVLSCGSEGIPRK